MPLSDLALPPRVNRLLEAGGVDDLATLVALTERELLGLPGLGGAAIREIKSALDAIDRTLAADPYAPYACARHGAPAWDANLASFFLCDECAAKWQAEAFDSAPPEFAGSPVDGYCLNCNIRRDDVRLRQWLLCGTCERVARSIGRSIVAERFVLERWGEIVIPRMSELILRQTDVPSLRRRERDAAATKRAEPDFVARDSARDEDMFGFELKTGKSYLSGPAPVGARMGEFQLDASDCDDITAVISREGIPVYLVHVQVIDRAFPPTVRYVPLSAWWTDVFRMHDHFKYVRRRPRETRNAAYFATSMFEDFSTFAEHVARGGPKRLSARLKKGVPALYS